MRRDEIETAGHETRRDRDRLETRSRDETRDETKISLKKIEELTRKEENLVKNYVCTIFKEKYFL